MGVYCFTVMEVFVVQNRQGQTQLLRKAKLVITSTSLRVPKYTNKLNW